MKTYSDNTVTRDYFNDTVAKQNAEFARVWQWLLILTGMQVVNIGILCYFVFR